MKRDDSNKKYEIIIAGILVISIVSVFLVIALGIKFSDTYKEQIPMFSILENNKQKNIGTPRGNDDVPIDQTIDDDEVYSVDPGLIEFVSDNIESPLPICLTPQWGADKWVVFRVYGGYTPATDFGMIVIKQYNDKYLNPCNPNMWVGWNLIVTDDWVDCNFEGINCLGCWHYYNVSFDTSCDNWICLDSTTDPDEKTDQLEKYVTIEYDTTWIGCQFDYILAHENHVPESLIPDKISSPI